MLKRLSASTPAAQALALLEEDGGVVIEGMFARATIRTMADAVEEAAARFKPGGQTQGLGADGKGFAGANTTRFSSLGKISPAYFEMLENDFYRQMADAMLLPNCGSYWVNTGQAMLIGPGSPAQVLHRDCMNWSQYCMALWPNCPEITLSAMIALDDVTEELGATRVLPGSHKDKAYVEAWDPAQTVPAEMKVGDAFLYTGKVVHGGGANRTKDRWRKAMHLSFLAGWLTPEESSPIDYTDEELARCSPRVQRLLGHRSYDPRPLFGGGLWLRNANKIEDQSGLS
ncbi:MAG TPA: phytanoyl-CoA dioxygenase family protein [Rhizomicrobium sp.]|nr:phytanoyl-CoA dioxygenase family protein [Rhizomicrobium sp.]